MSKTIDYYLALMSPWCYLGHQRLIDLAKRKGAIIAYKPIDFGPVLTTGGGLPLAQRAPARQAYRLVELPRWSAYLGIPLTLKPKYFPVPDTKPAGMVIAAGRAGQDMGKLAGAFLRAVWADERNIADDADLEAIAQAEGYDGKALLAQAMAPEVQAVRTANTEEALARQVFGLPTYMLAGEMFWGQDRLDFLERALG
ncbi:MAG: 2-hydroxychromene-2-carboxylate isomerase [Rhodospirillales bacterium]|nr:2-hydroxychromene-2-carboxylate isomerase [Rhodospirillales bacterium]